MNESPLRLILQGLASEGNRPKISKNVYRRADAYIYTLFEVDKSNNKHGGGFSSV